MTALLLQLNDGSSNRSGPGLKEKGCLQAGHGWGLLFKPLKTHFRPFTLGPPSAVVVLWSLTSPYHFSSPAIDFVSVGRRTDKGMCMTLPSDTAETTSESKSLEGKSVIEFILVITVKTFFVFLL